MHTELLQSIGLSQTEAKVYESLLASGPATASASSLSSEVNRRNVYDALAKLLEKGLLVEHRSNKETLYEAVEPRKLADLLQEKQNDLEKALPALEAIHASQAVAESAYVYRGIEGWKAYLRDVLTLGSDIAIVGAKDHVLDTRLLALTRQFEKTFTAQGLKAFRLFDDTARTSPDLVVMGPHYRFLSATATTGVTMAILADRVVYFSGGSRDVINDDTVITVVVNQALAEAQRVWFRYMWSFASEL